MINKKKMQDPIRSFNLYKIRSGITVLDLENYINENYKGFIKEEININYENFFKLNENQIYNDIDTNTKISLKSWIYYKKEDGRSKTGISWLLENTNVKLNQEIEFLSYEAINYFLILESNILNEKNPKKNKVEIFIIQFKGKILLNDKYIDNKYLQSIVQKISIDTIKAQSITSPNSEIVKSDQILKGRNSGPLSDVGDLFKSITLTPKFNEKIRRYSSQNIKINNGISSSFKSGISIKDVYRFLEEIIEIYERQANSEIVNFLTEELSEEIISIYWKNVIKKINENNYEEWEFGYSYDDFLLEYEDCIYIKEIQKPKEISRDDWNNKVKEFRIKDKKIEENTFIHYLKFVSSFTELNFDIDYLISELITGEIRIKLYNKDSESKKRSFSIKKYLDIWEQTLTYNGDEYNGFMISGIWYKNNDSYSDILINFIKNQYELKNIIHDNFGEFGEIIPHNQNIKEEDEYNKMFVYENEGKDFFLLDKKLINESAGRYELADILQVTENASGKLEITFYAVKHNFSISNCKYVFNQSDLALKNLSDRKFEKIIEDIYEKEIEKKRYFVIINHNSSKTNLANEIKSFMFKKNLVDYFTTSKKFGYEHKIFVNKKIDTVKFFSNKSFENRLKNRNNNYPEKWSRLKSELKKIIK